MTLSEQKIMKSSLSGAQLAVLSKGWGRGQYLIFQGF